MIVTKAGTYKASQNWRGRALRGHFLLKKKRALSENKKGTSSFIAKSWGTYVPLVPSVSTSMNQREGNSNM